MKALKVIIQIGVLSVFYLIGTWIQQIFHLFIPGSIIGMLLLLIALLTKSIKETWVSDGSSFIISHLPFLFIPVTTGIIKYLDIFKGKGLLLFPIALVSSLLLIVFSGAISQYIVRKRERQYE